ncbi:hypothetical protein APR40_06575 [Salegentibacter salarius]|uniref:Glycosyltransferase RgtA/B/C/D-like domain-containing protein n=1 Tax=Salegentibacter salarius TaxID=435906 RepID=A0A2N0U4V0_9FLAO|nr:hypothetical protein APR40_06575 [Salegentibacter salarius]
MGVYNAKLGSRHYESLFISDKLQLLFKNEDKTLELFYFIYPNLAQLFAIPAALINIERAPVITSALFMAFFAAYLVVKLFQLELKYASVLVSLYFLCSPMMLSAATSGSSLYLYLIFYFLFFHLIFRYIRYFTTYNFVLLSLCLTLFVFLNYKFLWILVFMIPLVFLLSLFKSSGIDKSYLGIFSQITQNLTATKELLQRSLSTFLIILFTPVMSLLCYFLINFWFTGDSFFFERSEITQWDQSQFFTLGTVDTSITYLLKLCLYLSPLFIAASIIGRKKLLFQLTLLLVPLWVMYSKNTASGTQLFLPVLLIITASGIAAFIHLFQTPLLPRFKRSRILYSLTTIVFILTVLGEGLYFKNTHHSQETQMLTFLDFEQPLYDTPAKNMADFVNNNLGDKPVILSDNKLVYPVMSLSRKNTIYLDQFKADYYKALQAPGRYADYLLVSKAQQSFFVEDQLTRIIEDKMASYYLVYSNSNYQLFKISR